MRLRALIVIIFIALLVIPVEVILEVSTASAIFENILGTGCLKLYFANGTEIPVCQKIGEEVIEYQGKNMTADVYITAGVRVLEYWYDPSTATFHVKLDGIYVTLYYVVWYNYTHGNETISWHEYAGAKAGFKVHGYGLFYAHISKSHPRPVAMWQMVNGTPVMVNFNCTEGVDCVGREVWNVTALIHFSTTEVIILSPMVVLTVILIVIPVALFVRYIRRRRRRKVSQEV